MIVANREIEPLVSLIEQTAHNLLAKSREEYAVTPEYLLEKVSAIMTCASSLKTTAMEHALR